MQNILNHEQITDDDSKWLTIARGNGIWPFGLFHEAHFEIYNFLMLFSSHPNPSFTCSYIYVIFCMDLYPKRKIIMLNFHN